MNKDTRLLVSVFTPEEGAAIPSFVASENPTDVSQQPSESTGSLGFVTG
jgi:hypothetical protein